MSITCTIQINLKLDSKRLGTVKKSLEPDNIDFPLGLEMHTLIREDTGIISVSGDLPHVIGTVDEILSHTQVVLEVVEK